MPPAWSTAARSAVHHAAGSTSVPSGCGADPLRTSAPDSASRTTTLHDWVDESTPATSGMVNTSEIESRAGELFERAASTTKPLAKSPPAQHDRPQAAATAHQ